jgi:hypothetical protein
MCAGGLLGEVGLGRFFLGGGAWGDSGVRGCREDAWNKVAASLTKPEQTKPNQTKTNPNPNPKPNPPRGNGEGEFIFWRGELLAGTLDKAQFGKFGLVHAIQARRQFGGGEGFLLGGRGAFLGGE